MSAVELPTNDELRLGEILTLEEAAAYLRVPEDALLKLAGERAVPARQIGNAWRFLKRALNDWLRYDGHPLRDGWPFSPHGLLDSPFAEELLAILEQRLLHKLEAAAPKPGSKEAVMKHFGVFKGDPDLQERIADAHARRETAG